MSGSPDSTPNSGIARVPIGSMWASGDKRQPALQARDAIAQAIGHERVPEFVDRHRDHECDHGEQRDANLIRRDIHDSEITGSGPAFH